MARQRIHDMPFAKVYPAYVAKALRKGRTKAEVDEIIQWLTGYDGPALTAQLERGVGMETFLTEASAMNPGRLAITGRVCGVRVEEVEDPVMREIRYLDKLIDELAQGRAMERILRR